MEDLSPFESARILIEGAKNRISDLAAGCDAFLKGCTYEIVEQRNLNTGDKYLKFRFGQRIPPRLRHITSGIINDLRSALDHAFCDAALLLGRTNANGVHFPFSKSALEIDGQIKRVCRGVEPALCDFAKTYRPYIGGDDFLYKLSVLSNMNKHQSIIKISLAEQALTFNLTKIGAFGRGEIEIGIIGWNDLRNEITFARIGKDRFIPVEPQEYVTPAFKIVLEQGEPPLSDPADACLDILADKIEGIIAGLERETARILEARQPS